MKNRKRENRIERNLEKIKERKDYKKKKTCIARIGLRYKENEYKKESVDRNINIKIRDILEKKKDHEKGFGMNTKRKRKGRYKII